MATHTLRVGASSGLKVRKRCIVDFGALVCVVFVMIILEVEFPLAIGWHDLTGVAIYREEPCEIIARHPTEDITIVFVVDPELDPWFRFELLDELCLSPFVA